MKLKKYQTKRDFTVTPEPKGKSKPKKKNHNRYLIQKHDASHLHYDFRLELNGVLLSWAVPKGPCLDPNVKRLAVHVEDHPLEYGSFEGIIPEGQYGGGTVMLWDKGTWHCEDANASAAYHKGSLTFTLDAIKLHGRWKLIRMHNDDKTWLLIKIKDEYAKAAKSFDITKAEPNSVVSQMDISEIGEKHGQPRKKKLIIKQAISAMPKVIHPELATLVDSPPIGKNWVHEIKFDGYRLIAYKHGKEVILYTRNQKTWTDKFASVAQAISKLPIKNLILDGEVVVLDKNQRSDFQLLQNAIKEQNTPFHYYIFDLLYYDKYQLLNSTLKERKHILKELMENNPSDVLCYSDHSTDPGLKVFKQSCHLGFEGIVSKDLESVYSQTRDRNWLKTKCIKRQEFVIGGYLPSKRRQYFRSLMLGTFNAKHELLYNGNVGTGFTETSLKSLQDAFKKYESDVMPFKNCPSSSREAIWLKPVLVAEVEFTEWTNANSLRHPSFKGLRSDKPAKNIVKEVPMSHALTHPDKKMYPESSITKSDVADYYEAIHEWILPFITNRALSLVRCPSNYKQCFFQKHFNGEPPKGIFEKEIQGKLKADQYFYIKNIQGLMSLVQSNVLEIHPWSSQINKIEYPDFITFDLDPDENVPWKKVVQAAFDVKNALSELNLQSFVKTTGGKGLHVVIPIKPEHKWDEIKAFTHVLVNYLVMNNPETYIGNMSKLKRKNKIFIDYLRNQRGATAIAPYSTRARKGAPVSVPLAWDELTNNRLDTVFTIKNVIDRLNTLKSNPWESFFTLKQKLKIKDFK